MESALGWAIVAFSIAAFALIALAHPTARAPPRRSARRRLVVGAGVLLVDLAASAAGRWRYDVAAGLGHGAAISALSAWRVVRPFGQHGLAAFVPFFAVSGPLRDCAAAAVTGFISVAPGVGAVTADSASWAAMVLAGYGVVRLVSGPAARDGPVRSRTT